MIVAKIHFWKPWISSLNCPILILFVFWLPSWHIVKAIWVNFWPKSNLRPVLGWHRSCLRPQNSQNKLITAPFLQPNWFGHTVVNNNHLKSQEYLDNINQWTEDNLMMLNAKKTKSMQFNFSKNLQFKTDLVLKQQTIENVQEIKLLGVILTSDLRWDRNIDYLVKDANKRMIGCMLPPNLQVTSKF